MDEFNIFYNLFTEMHRLELQALVYIHCKPNTHENKVYEYTQTKNPKRLSYKPMLPIAFSMHVMDGLMKRGLIRPSKQHADCWTQTQKGAAFCHWLFINQPEYDLRVEIRDGGAA